MIQIRRYRKGEEEILRQLCRDTTLRVNVDEYGSKLVEKWASRLDDRVDWLERIRHKNPFVAVIEDELVGFAELTKQGNISAFYTHYLRQKQGAGSALLNAVVEEAEQLEIAVIRVESSCTASDFFVKRGFEPIEEKTTFTDGLSSRSIVLHKQTGISLNVKHTGISSETK